MGDHHEPPTDQLIDQLALTFVYIVGIVCLLLLIWWWLG